MTGEMLAMRRAAVGAPVSEYSRLVDRARVNSGGRGMSVATANAVTASSTMGVQLTAGAQHVKGTPWTQLVASTSFAAETLIITLHEATNTNAANTGMLLDIGIGASSAETVLVPDLLCGFGVATSSAVAGIIGQQTFIIPIAIPAGSRLSGRIQGHTASDTITVGLQYRASGFCDAPGVAITAHGVTSSGATTGTAPTTVGSTNTKGSWTDLVTATTATYRYLLVTMQGPATTTTTAADGLVDIGVDTSGGTSYSVIIPDLPYGMTSNEAFVYKGAELPFKVSLPVGTRIACRYQSSSTNANGKPVVAVYGVT